MNPCVHPCADDGETCRLPADARFLRDFACLIFLFYLVNGECICYNALCISGI